MSALRLTNISSVNETYEQRQRERVPESVARHHGPEGLEIAARQLAREGYSDHAIADALKLSLQAVRIMIGSAQP